MSLLKCIIHTLILFLFFLLDHANLFGEEWNAYWITHPEVKQGNYSILHFRNSFTINEKINELKIRISADIRYKLYLNGTYLGQGPANNDLRHYSYDTYDLASFLSPGKNVLAAEVWSLGEVNPVRFQSERARFIFMAETPGFDFLDTGTGNWKVFLNKAYSATLKDIDFQFRGSFAMGGGEQIDASKYPWGWKQQTYNDETWVQPGKLVPGRSYGFMQYFGHADISLSPRMIPMMDESEIERPLICSLKGGIPLPATKQSWNEEKTMVIPANGEFEFLLDQKYLTKGHPFFVFSKGKGAKIEITYAEALLKPDGTKGNRNEIEGKEIHGVVDRYFPDGGEMREYSPLLNRTWRYIGVKIKTANEHLEWNGFRAKKFIYPFGLKATFQSGEELHRKILDVGWLTARLCADETYMDCPYYEQLQYIGDTRIQALISLYCSGDDRLMRNAITQFINSITDEGITQSRFPAWKLQYIPPYALFLANMVYDYHMHCNDDAFTQSTLKKITGILLWFEDRLREDKLLGPMPWWSYVDAIKDFKMSSPPGSWEGGSSVLSLQFVYALQDAVELFKYHSKTDLANHFENLKKQIQKAVIEKTFDTQKQLFADTPEKKSYSEHANIFAILTNTVPGGKKEELFKRMIADSSLTKANIYFRFYLLRASQQSGQGDYFINNLGLWEHMLNEGLTTYAEHILNTRSDCHAWSAYPNYEFFNTVLGIQPSKPHFEAVLIEPNLGNLNKVNGSIPHPAGEIKVSYAIKNDVMTGEVILPPKITGVFRWKGLVSDLKSGANRLNFQNKKLK